MSSPALNIHHREACWRGSCGHQTWVVLCSRTHRHTLNTKVTNALDRILLEVGRWGQGCPMHLLHHGISMREEPPCSTGASTGSGPFSLLGDRQWGCGRGGQLWLWPLPPCTGDACRFPCRGMLQKAFWVHIRIWRLRLAGSSEFKAELCLHEKRLWGLCFKPATCNKILMKGWLKPQPKFQTYPSPGVGHPKGPGIQKWTVWTCVLQDLAGPQAVGSHTACCFPGAMEFTLFEHSELFTGVEERFFICLNAREWMRSVCNIERYTKNHSRRM